MRTPAEPGLLLVATRELRWMRRDGVALILALLVPVLAFAILTLTFSNAVVRNLRVAIVDADRSPTSLLYVQSIGSAPGVTVAERSSDMRSAMQAIRAGDAIAAVYVPENFERDLLARKRPQVVSLYNRRSFTRPATMPPPQYRARFRRRPRLCRTHRTKGDTSRASSSPSNMSSRTPR